MNNRWLIFGSTIFLVIIFIIVISLGLFDGWMFFGLLFFGILFPTGYTYVIREYEQNLDDEHNRYERRKDLAYGFGRINDLLRNFPGGQGLSWDSGVNRNSYLKYFHNGERNVPFRAFMGYLSSSSQLVLVIYDIEGDVIADYITDIDSNYLSDPFYKFDPFKGSRSTSMRMNPYMNPYYNRSRSRRRTLNMDIPPITNSSEYDDRGKMEDIKSKPTSDVIDELNKRVK